MTIKTCPVNCADRINLGLIPTSEGSYETAANALKIETGGYMHIHGNVDIKNKSKNSLKDEWLEWSGFTVNKMKMLLEKRNDNIKWQVTVDHIEYVKSYGPRVDHLVLDICCRPLK